MSSNGRNSTHRSESSSQARHQVASRDAVDFLKDDHRQVEAWFEEFAAARSTERKHKLGPQICRALKMHTRLEEEIFYPAFLAATQETEIHHESEVEHQGAKRLVAEIEDAGPRSEYYEARVMVLARMIRQHVHEEEGRNGMFARARHSDMDLLALAEQLRERKQELTTEAAVRSG